MPWRNDDCQDADQMRLAKLKDTARTVTKNFQFDLCILSYIYFD